MLVGLITILNDYEASEGRPSLRFISPWLYLLQNGHGPRDIVLGASASYHGPLGSFPLTHRRNYNATVGRDALTCFGVFKTH
jgi:tripeptidyl-peptidase-1